MYSFLRVSAGRVSTSGHFALNAEPETRVRFGHVPNVEPERSVLRSDGTLFFFQRNEQQIYFAGNHRSGSSGVTETP
jgi:hypothetical protein